MANPDFRSEASADQAGSTSVTLFMPTSWQANDILVVFVATDGYVPTLSTPNGFVIAQDPLGNSASITTNAGTPGTSDCGMFIFWKRATGSNTTADPAPIIAAPVNGGTCWCLETNSYSGARTTGTPWHIITTAIVSTATTTVAPPSVTPSLASCLVMACAASTADDTAFNAWTFSGAASPSGQIDAGWHTSIGNACSFTAGRGGYASVGGARSGSTTYATSTRQAQISMVMASLAEPTTAIEEDTYAPHQPPFPGHTVLSGAALDAQVEEVAQQPTATAADDDAFSQPQPQSWSFLSRYTASDAEIPSISTAVDEDAWWPIRTYPVVQPFPPPSQFDEVGSVVAPGVTGIFNGGGHQRSNGASPETGTLTTPAPVASWVTLTAYVIDPTAGGINRVQLGGNLYQCSQSGTSGITGPSGTGTNIVDGTARWYYVGPVLGTNTVAGSQVIGFIARGVQANVPGGVIAPSDNDGGSFSLITNNAYASFPASFAGVWRRTAAANDKTNYTASALWGGVTVGGGAGDEMSLAWLALENVAVGAPHTFSQVERSAPTGGTVTAAAITTTKRCLIVSIWFGNGTVQTAGQPDTAAPTGGLVLAANGSFPLSLTTGGYIQWMAAWRIASPGTSAEVWSSTTNEGAQLVTLAFEDLTSLSVGDDLNPATLSVPPQPTPWASAALIGRIAELTWEEIGTLSPQVDDDGAPSPVVAPAWPWLSWVQQGIDDSVAVVPDDDDTPTAPMPPLAPWNAWSPATDDGLPVLAVTLDDDCALLIYPPAPVAWAPRVIAIDDDASPAPPLATDDDAAPTLAVPAWSWWPRIVQADDDEPATVALSAVDEDPSAAGRAAPQAWWAFAFAITDDAPAPAASIVDDESLAAAIPAPQAWAVAPHCSDDEAPSTAVDDEPPRPTPTWQGPAWATVLACAIEEDLPVALPQVDDANWTFAVAWPAPPAPPVPADPDDLPIPGPPGTIIESPPYIVATPWPLDWRLHAPALDDDLGGLAAPPPEDHHVRIDGVSPDPEVLVGPIPDGDDVLVGPIGGQGVFG